jgi:uncharacterized protein (TIGR00369 family)
MKKIINPWISAEDNVCFGSAPNNEHGLQLEFHEDGEEIICVWEPKSHFQSWLNTLHGGIHCALMDETGAWVIIEKLKTAAVTFKMETRFLKAIYINQGKITVRARLKHTKRNIAVVEVNIYNADDELCSKAEISYFTFPKDIAIEKFNYKEPNTEDED